MSIKITWDQLNEELVNLRSRQNDTDEHRDAFQEAASVLIYFEPEKLNAFYATGQTNTILRGWADYFTCCEPVRNMPNGNWWQLKEYIRLQALKRLGSKERMLQALKANPERTTDPPQQLFDRILEGKQVITENLDREEMVIAMEILNWLKETIPMTDAIQSIQQAIPLADLLAPMQRLAKNNFVGRKTELAELQEYIGVNTGKNILSATKNLIRSIFSPDLEKNPPFLIYGPGGVGKSTLLSKFILTNADNIEKGLLPFIYLDIDRVIINPEEPNTLLVEATRQLATQCPAQKDELLNLKDKIVRRRSTTDKLESSKSFDFTDLMIHSFGEIVSTINAPVLLVIDTFEEAQFLGKVVVDQIWRFLVSMQKAAPNLRTIVAGRALVKGKDFNFKILPLNELYKDEARQLLTNILVGENGSAVQKNLVDDIIDIVGLNPLSLRLGAAIVKSEGIEKLKTVETRSWLVLKIRSELVQARLYGRILAHVHDEQVKKLAYPGLIVRRITAEIITQVLAEPCGLTIKDEQAALKLFNMFSKEIALVDTDTDGALSHRQDVRKIMLADLKNVVAPELIRTIHQSAINYYQEKNDPASRAEEIYHLLCLGGENLEQAKQRWMTGIESRLRNALEELQPTEQLWLSEKLGVTPDADLLKNADLEFWEQATARSAQRYLQNGNASLALDIIREREHRTPASPLFVMELEALRSQGLYNEASFIAGEILSNYAGMAPTSLVRELLTQNAFIEEAQSDFDAALVYIRRAKTMLRENPDTLEHIRILITEIRILRKKGTQENPERLLLINTCMKLLDDPKVLFSLNNSPALFREIVAELGKIYPALLQYAIDWLGVDLQTTEQMSIIATGLYNWNNALLPFAGTAGGELALRAGIKKNELPDWQTFVSDNVRTNLINLVQNWRLELSHTEDSKKAVYEFDKALVDLYRTNVEKSIDRSDAAEMVYL